VTARLSMGALETVKQLELARKMFECELNHFLTRDALICEWKYYNEATVLVLVLVCLHYRSHFSSNNL